MGSLLACVCSLISCLVYTRTNVRLGSLRKKLLKPREVAGVEASLAHSSSF